MVYKYYSHESEHALDNFNGDQICFNYIGNFDDKNEFDLISEDKDIRCTGLDLSPYLKEYRAFITRVCSLCKKKDSAYMWKEYASDEKGFCLGYESKDIIKANKNIICGDVIYDDTTPELSESSSPKDIFKNQIFHKMTEFENEEELRLAYIFPEDSIKIVDFCKEIEEDEYIVYLPVPKKLIEKINPIKQILPKIKNITVVPKELIIGKCCCDEDRRRLKEIADEKKIKVYER